MQTWWAFAKTSNGSMMKVTVQADNPYQATEMLKAIYGDRLTSDFASAEPTSTNYLSEQIERDWNRNRD